MSVNLRNWFEVILFILWRIFGDSKTCSKCHGTGTIYLDSSVYSATECPQCNGKGEEK
jgi:DnaJ-class molecular chaperone